ncbi:2-amino-4-hydroxy-6-hydroxymethyldihydropteridine diphosphokinase [Idiomarina xiamenensis]|uniref:2-amino-4-hydroxy-6-hydroxymethyldihydropteridine pyrophosphokinase n=1 Tax=Idiomarina xiamenensis 10-D-4 TaxID=740709 RepID=K2JVK3_9GAMM|nr:2-amino-4-hydroxy-6-hydroxymethyldihydropteridine diphosphokinase [Idiomarina xiamenensis]EKE87451.1 2-amino-4-hydroxy-6- hydroxymethyldihyropteridine pyrophosphokinase [Idiomarina xiamenensis 10-D-4]
MSIVYIGMGANLNNPAQTLYQALQVICHLPSSCIGKVSSFYLSKPMGPQDQPDYVNAVIELHSDLTPEVLLESLQMIEDQFGRQRTRRWGERTLDLDILWFEGEQRQSPTLTLPHPGLREREFVVMPLLEIAPALVFEDGVALSDIAAQLPQRQLSVLISSHNISQLGQIDEG